MGNFCSNITRKKPQSKPRYERTYVTVNVTTDRTGTMRPEKVIWSDHRCYDIEAIKDFHPAKTIGNFPGDCYVVVINGKVRRLFFDRNDTINDFRMGRWFVLTPVN